jgi:hypothetical protein
MSESEKSFTVRDRRHFTPDGQVREETEAETSPASSEPQPAPAPPVEDPPAGGGASEIATPGQPKASPSSPDQGSASPDGFQAGPADFTQFLLSLGVQASALLSGEGLPEDADPQAVLDGARSLISILEMLRDKTEGRRTAQEEEVLEGLLFELRMAYVEKSRAGGS